MIWLQLAWRDLYRNARRSLFAVGIAAIGAVAAIATGGYLLSTFTAVRESTIRGGVGHLQIATADEFSGYEDRVLQNALTPQDVARIEDAAGSLPEVAFSLPRLAFQGIVSNGERSLVMLGEGVDSGAERRLSALYVPIVEGEGLDPQSDASPFTAVVGREMARLLGIGPGDYVTLLAISSSGGLNAIDVEIKGLFATGSPELDRMRLLVPLAAAHELLQSDRVRRIVLALESTEATAHVKRALAERLPDLEVRDWQELSPFYRQLVALYLRQAAVLAVVLATVVLLAVFTSVAMGVMERRRDIGILLSLGIPAARVRRMFLLQGALLGGIGGIGGAVSARVILWIVNSAGIRMPPAPGQTESYPLFIAFDPSTAALTAGALCLLGLAAGWTASLRVTRESIVTAMHRE
ncbi:MAG: FtsX-like permease family protein [Pseudomonadota bacterium]|jgi:ABC-type transport system, involved in lipoprotein release, permease component|nr:MAG: hypothetical protein DIU56_14775 [Pseudomonadota bacterium]